MTERAKERAYGAAPQRVPCATCGHEKLRHRLRRYLVYLLTGVALILAIPAIIVWTIAAEILIGRERFKDMPLPVAWDTFWEEVD